jgi:negative regulator of sigma E activity
MFMRIDTHKAAACVVLCGFFAALFAVANEDVSPDVWLDRMTGAVQTTDYEGTVVRLQDGKVEAFKVVHAVSDGVVIQDGNGLEIIRNGNEVHCIFPDHESVLVEEWNNQSTLFSTLPSSDIRFGSEYDVLIKGFERVAGRKTVKLAILPHDNYRYGYRIWLDVDTGFPLQTQLIGNSRECPDLVLQHRHLEMDRCAAPQGQARYRDRLGERRNSGRISGRFDQAGIAARQRRRDDAYSLQ